MEKAKMSNKKKILLLAAVLVLVGIIAGAVAIKKQIDKKTDDASWAEYYMEQCAPYTLAYDELPGDIESWRAWQPGGFGIDKLTDDDNDRIGKNDLGTLSYAYEKLVEIRLVEPENDQCRELFETLTPYFEKAFHWEEGTTPEECLKRLQEFSEEEAMEEIEELVGPVWNRKWCSPLAATWSCCRMNTIQPLQGTCSLSRTTPSLPPGICRRSRKSF